VSSHKSDVKDSREVRNDTITDSRRFNRFLPRGPSVRWGRLGCALVPSDTSTDTETENDTGTDTSVDTDTNTDVDIDTVTEFDTGKDTDVDTDTRIDTGADIDTDADIDSDTSTDIATDDDTHTDTDPDRVFGITVDDPWGATASECPLNAKLDGLVGGGGRKPTVRVVFDEYVSAFEYIDLVGNIAPHAIVMGELLDSFYVADYSLNQYRQRACEYRATLGDLVDIWEIGNEVNGEWLGDDVLDKLAVATEVFTADTTTFNSICDDSDMLADEKPFRIALTFYYNGSYNGGTASEDNCWETAANAMEYWSDRWFMVEGEIGTEQIAPYLDMVLVSYYEDDCEDIQPEWQLVFDSLGDTFPKAALGFGECGTTSENSKVAYVERYYRGMDLPNPKYSNMHIDHPRFVGGYFWWYFSEDMDNVEVYNALVDSLEGSFWSE
jgi:hypothetical protein